MNHRGSTVARLRGRLERHPLLLPALIILLGAIFRLFNINWDAGHQLHPDEREIYMVISGANGNVPLGLPTSISQFFAVQEPSGGSPLNPHFFAYGSLPFYLLAAISTVVAFIGQHVPGFSSWALANTYGGLPYVGRPLAAGLDLLSVALIFLLGRRVFGYWTGVLAMALVAFTVLNIQLAHFYTVDTVLLPFVLLTLLGATSIVTRGSGLTYLLTGVAMGAAMATKTTALLLIIPVGAAAVLSGWNAARWEPGAGSRLDALRRHYGRTAVEVNRALQWVLATFLVAALSFALFEPYGVLDRATLLRDIAEQNSFLVSNNPPFGVPFTIQYAGTTPYIYQFQNIVFWSLGIPLGLTAFLGVLVFGVRAIRLKIDPRALVLLVWIVPYFLFVGRFFAKFNRYMLPITPVMTILGAAVLVWLATHATRRLRPPGWAAIALVLVVSFGYSLAYMNIYANPNTRVEASSWIYAHIPSGTRIAVESPWDDTLPMPQAEGSPTQYPNQINLDLYATECSDARVCLPADVNRKVANITDALRNARYIIMSSERLVASIPKLPARYPIAVRYYQLLAAGKLNFRLVKVFQRHPQLGPIVVHDYPADESFHVYDHPIVRIYRQVRPISAAAVRALLLPPGSEATKNLAGQSLPVNPPKDRRLMLTPSQIAQNRQGPTYNQMFPPNGFAARNPILVWWLLLELLGLIAFPLVFAVFRGLRDRGFIIAKTIGLLAVGWVVWISVSLGLTTYDRGLLYLTTAGLAVLSLLLAARQRRALLAFIRVHWREVARAEIVFLVAFGIGLFLRAWYPDLGHQWSAVSPTNEGGGRMGEKQMELAFLNAIVRSRTFPPFDPFFAGGYINYYYYGFYLVATLCKMAQIGTSVGFNLAVASLFGLLLGSAYSVGSSITRRVTPGVLAAVLVGLIGNLGGAWELIQNLMAVAGTRYSFPIVGGTINVISGTIAVLLRRATLAPIDMWNPTRIVPGGAITEFPYFTFLFADLHPHVIDYPMTVAAIAFAWSLVRTRPRGVRRVATVLTGALLLGGIAVTNPWDYPTYLMVAALGAATGTYLAVRRLTIRVLFRPALWTVGLAVLSAVAYLPFKLGYQTVFETGLGLTRDITPSLLGPDVTAAAAHDILVTPLRVYIEHFGLFLAIVLSYLAVLLLHDAGLLRAARRSWLLLRFAVYYRERPIHVVHAIRVARRLMCRPREAVLDPALLIGLLILTVGLAFLGYYLISFLVALAGLTALLVLRLAHRLTRWEVFTLLLLLVPVALSIGTQIFFVKDFLAGGSSFRMNTIFKFYNQAWVLYAVCSAALAYALMNRWLAASRPVRSTMARTAATMVDTGTAAVQPVALSPTALHAELPVAVGGPQEHMAVPAIPEGNASTRPPLALLASEAEGVSAGGDGPAVARGFGHRARGWFPFSAWRRPSMLVDRHPLWAGAIAALLLASFVYTYGGTINRETFRSMWLPQNSVPWTLDGMAFMKVAYPQDYAGIQWLNANVRGAQVIAEAHAPLNGYTWPSRVSMFTGLPDILNGIHEGEQRYADELNPGVNCGVTRDPGACATRFPSREDDLKTLYDSAAPSDAWRIIRRYDVRYIFVGFSERHCVADICYSRAGLAKFRRMVGHGLQVAFRRPGITIYRVTA